MSKAVHLIVFSQNYFFPGELESYLDSRPEVADWAMLNPTAVMVKSELDIEALAALYKGFAPPHSLYLITRVTGHFVARLPEPIIEGFGLKPPAVLKPGQVGRIVRVQPPESGPTV